MPSCLRTPRKTNLWLRLNIDDARALHTLAARVEFIVEWIVDNGDEENDDPLKFMHKRYIRITMLAGGGRVEVGSWRSRAGNPLEDCHPWIVTITLAHGRAAFALIFSSIDDNCFTADNRR